MQSDERDNPNQSIPLIDDEKRNVIRHLRLIDDAFFAVVFQNDTELTQFILRIILNRDDLVVTRASTQYSIKGLGGHSVILDAAAVDKDGRLYDIEVQKPEEGAIPRRARFYGSMMDSEFFKKSEKYEDLRETYIIFITEKDVLNGGLPIYHINRVIEEMQQPFDDGQHIIYINASHADDTPLGMLMHDSG